MTLKDILKTTSIFKSTIWGSIVDEIRDHVDPVDEHELFTFNSVDEYINMEFGDWEVVPDLHEDDVLDQTELQRRVDSVIGANRDYWIRYVESLEAVFNPLYNVDAYETTINSYGSHLRTDVHGAKSRTDSLGATSHTQQHGAQTDTMQYGQRQTTTQYGQQEITAGQRQDTHVNGAQSIEHSETTMDSLTYKAKTKDDHATYTDTDTTGSQTTTSGQHSDSFTQQQATDTTGRAAYTDTDSTTPVTNTATEATFTDTSTSGEHTDRVTIRRYGNIGVTKSTELLEAFQEFARKSKIVPVIAVEISKALSFSVWY